MQCKMSTILHLVTQENPRQIEKMRLTEARNWKKTMCSVYSAYLQAKRHMHIRLNIRSRQLKQKEDQNVDKVTYWCKVCYKTEMQHFRTNCARC